MKILKTLHGFAATVHFVQFIAVLVLIIGDEGSKWPIVSQGFEDISKKWTYYLSYLVPLFPALSTVNHATAFFASHWYEDVLKKKCNPVRWAEYSLSAGIMLWVIATLSGIIEIRTLISLAMLNAALQYVGYLIEKTKSTNGNAKPLLLVGFAIHVTIWTQILISFFTVINQSANKAPPGIYSIIIIMFILFSSFGVWASMWVLDIIKTFDILEMGYIILSLIAKTFLTWMVYFGVLKSDQRFEITKTPI